jgi:superfamily I DNA/RNA helicase
LIDNNNYSYKDIAIIICSNNTVSFDPNSNLPDIPSRSLLLSNQRDDFDIDEDTVKIITVESSKGLEWKIVYLIGIDGMPRENRDAQAENNLIYIGMTRAQEKLKIYYCVENEIIRSLIQINSSL